MSVPGSTGTGTKKTLVLSISAYPGTCYGRSINIQCENGYLTSLQKIQNENRQKVSLLIKLPKNYYLCANSASVSTYMIW